MTNRWKRWLAPGAVLTATAVLAACSSSSSSSGSTAASTSPVASSSSSSTSAASAGVAKAQQMVTQLESTTSTYPGYSNFGVISSFCMGGALLLFAMSSALDLMGLALVCGVVWLLMVWPLTVRRFFSDRQFSELLAGEIQSGVLQEEQTLTALKKDAKLHVLVNYEEADPDYFYGTYVVSKSWLAGNQATVEKFLTAITMAHRFMYKNEAATVSVVAKNTGDSATTITKAYGVLLTQEGVFPLNSGLDTARISATITTMKKYKILTGTEPSVSSLVNAGPVNTVIARLGSMTDGNESD